MMNTEELLSAEQVLINPLNRSTSKQQYSFPKANRFATSKTDHSDDHFYDMPSTKSRIASSIGKERRTTFDNKNGFLPAPNNYTYRVDGQFGSSQNKKTRKGCYFALGRDDIKVNSFLTISRDSPNPGRYNPESQKSLARQYSFSRELRYRDNSKCQFPNIGPGSYRIISSLDEHKQILSSQRKSPAPKMAQIKVDNRKDKSSTKHPPLYKPKTTMRGDLVSLGSLKRGCMIGNSKRINVVTIGDIPGPGQYKVFSEFLGKGK